MIMVGEAHPSMSGNLDEAQRNSGDFTTMFISLDFTK